MQKEEDGDQPCHSLHGYSQERILHLKRKHCNLYSSATGDWLTFTSPVERRKRGGGVCAGFDRQSRHDGCVRGGRRADAAGWKGLLGLQADSAGWLSESRPDWRLELRGLVWQHRYKAASLAPANLTWFVWIFVIKTWFQIPFRHIFHINWATIILKLLTVTQKWFPLEFMLPTIMCREDE